MALPSTTSTPTPPPPFAEHARQVVRGLRGAFAELLASVRADGREPRSISQQLGLNKNLAWKISKIVQAEDPLVVLQQVPGSSGLNIFLRANEKAGANEALLQNARHAITEYEELIRVHCGDRATMEMMGSALSLTSQVNNDEQHRKLLFQGASYVWGVQARAILKIGLVGPGSEDGMLDFATLSGLLDFRRLRPDVSWVMAARESHNDDGTVMETSHSEAIDTRFAGPGQAPLMGDFSSKPLPELRRFEEEGYLKFELAEGQVGNMGLQTCVFGTIQRDMPYYRTSNNEWGRHVAHCDTPAEVLLLDLYFHESFTFAIPPEAKLFSELGGIPRSPRRKTRELPLNERLEDLGVDPLPVATPDVRQYNQMAQAMFDRLNWDPREFHGYRMHITYPACPTALVLRYRLPERP